MAEATNSIGNCVLSADMLENKRRKEKRIERGIKNIRINKKHKE
jgi:hypothetical protein